MANGEFTDDPSIPDDALLWPRIPPWHFTFDQREQRWRPSSAAFEDDPDGDPMSVVIAAESPGTDAVLAGAQHAGFALVAVTARLARQQRQVIVRAPTADEPAHAYVVGLKTTSIRRSFARKAIWVVPPSEQHGDDGSAL